MLPASFNPNPNRVSGSSRLRKPSGTDLDPIQIGRVVLENGIGLDVLKMAMSLPSNGPYLEKYSLM